VNEDLEIRRQWRKVPRDIPNVAQIFCWLIPVCLRIAFTFITSESYLQKLGFQQL